MNLTTDDVMKIISDSYVKLKIVESDNARLLSRIKELEDIYIPKAPDRVTENG